MIISKAGRALSHSALLLLLLATSAAQATPPSAEAFLRALYSQYGRNGTATIPASDPWLHPALVFTRATSAVIMLDRDVLDEPGIVDGDPICACQDWSALIVDKVTLHPATEGGTDATVVFHDGEERREVSYHLAQVNGHWAIADMSIFGANSPKWLVATMTDEIADLTGHK